MWKITIICNRNGRDTDATARGWRRGREECTAATITQASGGSVPSVHQSWDLTPALHA